MGGVEAFGEEIEVEEIGAEEELEEADSGQTESTVLEDEGGDVAARGQESLDESARAAEKEEISVSARAAVSEEEDQAVSDSGESLGEVSEATDGDSGESLGEALEATAADSNGIAEAQVIEEAGDSDSGEDEDTKSYKEIRTIADLYAINNDLTGNYRLMNDIDMSKMDGGDYDFEGNGWKPIGYVNNSGEYFTGTLDGNGHKIKNLTIKGTALDNYNNVGLFIGIGAIGIVKNLGLENYSIDSDLGEDYFSEYAVGGIAGRCNGTLQNCYASGNMNVSGERGTSLYAGGLIGYQGYSNDSTIADCYSDITITASGTSTYAGGICGYSLRSINNCYALKPVTNSDNSGNAQMVCYRYSGDRKNLYYLTASSEDRTDSEATGLSSTMMQSPGSFTGFDFENTWYIDKYADYRFPQLRSCPQIPITKVEVSKNPTKTEYLTTDKEIDLTGGELKLTYETSKVIDKVPMTEAVCSYEIKAGTQTVTLNYGGQSTSFDINVEKKEPTFTGEREITKYEDSETFKLQMTTDSDGKLDYAFDGNGIVSISNLYVTCLAPGEVPVTFFVPETDIYKAGSIDVKIIVKERKYSVSFNYEDGTGKAALTESIRRGELIEMPEEPERSGYIFGGWYTLKDGRGNRFTGEDPIMQEYELYAYWIKCNTITLHYEDKAGKTEILKIKEGETVVLPENPTREGYEFAGWFTKKNGEGTEFVDGAEISNDYDLYAYWLEYYTLTLDFGTGKTVTHDYYKGTPVTVSENTDREGYSFEGWYTEKNGKGNEFANGTQMSGNLTLYAYYVKTWSVTFYYEDGTEDAEKIIVKDGEKAEIIPEPERLGYAFKGWFTEKTGRGNKFTGDEAIKADTKLYAYWVKGVTVTFNYEDGTGKYDFCSLEAGDKAVLPETPERNGYRFAGWFTEKAGMGDEFDPDKAIFTDTSVYAYWIRYYTLAFNYEDGTDRKEYIDIDEGDAVKLPEDPVRTGYVFGGWFTMTEGRGTQITNGSIIRSDYVLYAYWMQRVNVTFHFEDGSKRTEVKVIGNGDTVSFPDAPAREGYTFSGWFTESDGKGSGVTSNTFIYNDTDLFAYWIRNPIVTFQYEDGSGKSESVEMEIGQEITLPKDPERSGYRFDGWYTEKDGDGRRLSDSSIVTESMTLYAYWVKSHKLTFHYEDGSDKTLVRYVDEGEEIELPYGPTRTGYSFDGWFTGRDGTGEEVDDDYVVIGDMDIYAYMRPYLTITFHHENDADDTSYVTVLKGDRITLPREPYRSSYVFMGWFTEKAGKGTKLASGTLATAEADYYAYWLSEDDPLSKVVTKPTNSNDPVTPSDNKINTSNKNIVVAKKGKYTLDVSSGDKVTSSNPKIVKIGKNNKVTVKKPGTAILTIERSGQQSVDIAVTVEKPKMKKAAASVGSVGTLAEIGLLKDTTYISPDSIESSNPSVAEVLAGEYIYVKSSGKAKITAYFGGKKYKAVLKSS